MTNPDYLVFQSDLEEALKDVAPEFTINGKSPDENGAIELNATDIGAVLSTLPTITDANTSIADSNPTGIKIERWSKTTLNTPYTQGLTTRSDGVVITSVIKGSFATQIAFPIGGRGLYIRPNIVGSIYAWSEYGDFKSDGSVAMTGTVLNMSNGEGSFENNGIDASIRVRSVANDDSNSTSLVLDNSFSTSPYRKLYLRDTVDGVNTDYKLYGEHNKPTAADVGAAGVDHTHDEYAASSHNHSASNITSGTLGVARGGTGATTFTSGAALIGAGTGAVTTRAITNNTSATSAITGSTNLVTMNTLKNAMNRATAPSAADTSYGTAMVRAIKASTTDLTAGTSDLTSGTIYIVYE